MELLDKRYEQVRLYFDPEPHKYTDTLGNEYLSMTTLVHRYAPKFEKEYWLKKKAKELGISEKELAKQWQVITDEACDRGTAKHDGLEKGIKGASKFKQAIRYLDDLDEGEMITVADIPNFNAEYKLLDLNQFIEHTDNKYPEIYVAFKKYTDAGYKIYAEIGMFLIDYLISGTIDVLLIRDDGFIIGDWKTNRGGLIFESGYYRKDKSQKPAQMTNEWIRKDESLLPPANALSNCNGSLYTLQTSGYAYSVERILNLPCRGIWLCHIDCDFILNEYGMPRRFEDGLYHIKNNPVEKTKFYVMPYRKDIVRALLEDRAKELKAIRINKQFSLGV